MMAVDRLYDKLMSYADDNYYPMHMPGHKRNTFMLQMDNPYRIDITEIEGFDNLHQSEGILKNLSQRLSRLYGAAASYPLINGSTAGILAAISAAANIGDEVLIARNSHKSVYHAAILRGLKPVYCYPPMISRLPIYGGITPEAVEEIFINKPGIKAVVITSPTYEGVVSDIKSISEVVHRNNAILVVDEAHGAHFGFHENFPQTAVRLGADIVIQSLHKTLPAFTQTAVLHCNREDLNDRLLRFLAIYQSSSPSYVLLAGIDRCITMLENQGEELFQAFDEKLEKFYQSLTGLEALKVVDGQCVGVDGVYDLDPSKITIIIKDPGLSGHQLQQILRKKYHIEIEMATPNYVLGMTSICDVKVGFNRLADALLEIDKEFEESHNTIHHEEMKEIKPEQMLTPQEASELKTEKIKLSKSEGRISAVFICLFPPGSPLLVPGERINDELLKYLNWIKKEGITITGLSGELMDEIEVICKEF
jgi:arginine decarboxylase